MVKVLFLRTVLAYGKFVLCTQLTSHTESRTVTVSHIRIPGLHPGFDSNTARRLRGRLSVYVWRPSKVNYRNVRPKNSASLATAASTYSGT